jgi:hypothetical protein
MFWQEPFPPLLRAMPPRAATPHAVDRVMAPAIVPVPAFGAPPVPARMRLAVPAGDRQALPASWLASLAAPPIPGATPLISAQGAVGHSFVLFAGLAQMQLPPPVLSLLEAAPSAVTERPSRWSADGWLMLRQDGNGPPAAVQPSYGRSQVGAVLRYRLSDTSPYRPQVYLRASGSLAGPREQELAAGLSARPLPGLPLRLAAEARVTRTVAGTEVRPALYAVTELPPAELPLGVHGEAYLQAGYVGGRYATGFIDGQARVERRIAAIGDNELAAGAGIWGGAQKGSARLDIGPSARVSFRLGDAQARVAADYRLRVAGDARPASGPALTLSAGF